MTAFVIIALGIGFGQVVLWVLLGGRESSRAKPPIIAGVLWVLWVLWETQVVEEGDNIRADLVLFLPVLLFFTVRSLFVIGRLAWDRIKGDSEPRPSPPPTII